MLDQPDDDDYLWRYIKYDDKRVTEDEKLHRIKDAVEGMVHFTPLSKFNDYFEGIDPLCMLVLSNIRTNVPLLEDVIKYHGQPNSLPKLHHSIGNLGKRLLFDFNNRQFKAEVELLKAYPNLGYAEVELNEPQNYFQDILQKHLVRQFDHLVSCWFVSDKSESALMWNCYSNESGIAIRIKFRDFKERLIRYIELLKKYDGIDLDMTLGLMKYRPHHVEESFLKEVSSGIPLHFYKHISFQHEREYRMSINSHGPKDGTVVKHNILLLANSIGGFEIILHPSTWVDEYPKLKAQTNMSFASLSELWFRVPK